MSAVSPSAGVVVSVAEQALEAIKQGGAEVIPQQAYFVLTSMRVARSTQPESTCSVATFL